VLSWTEFVADATPLTAIFGEQVPSAKGWVLHDLLLSRDGPELRFRVDLPGYPIQPPAKWRAAGFNTVQLQLAVIGVRDLSLRGLATSMIGDLGLSRREGAIALTFSGEGVQVEALVDSLLVTRVSAYARERG
jgi:hypothetical protein